MKLYLALNPKEVKDEVKLNNIPAKIKLLLTKFKEIFMDDLPMRLPPITSISHQIGLIPELSLLNKAHY